MKMWYIEYLLTIGIIWELPQENNWISGVYLQIPHFQLIALALSILKLHCALPYGVQLKDAEVVYK